MFFGKFNRIISTRGGKKMRKLATTFALALVAVAIFAAISTGAASAATMTPAATAGSTSEGHGGNSVVCNGVPSLQLLVYYANGGVDSCGHHDIAGLYRSFGITPQEAKVAKSGTVCTSDGNWVSTGRQHSPNAAEDRAIYLSGSRFYKRPLKVWGSTCYAAWKGTTEDGHKWAVLKGCGNAEEMGGPSTPPVKHQPGKKPVPSISIHGNKCSTIVVVIGNGNHVNAHTVCSYTVIEIAICSNISKQKQITVTRKTKAAAIKAANQKVKSWQQVNCSPPKPKPTPPVKPQPQTQTLVLCKQANVNVDAGFPFSWQAVNASNNPVGTRVVTWVKIGQCITETVSPGRYHVWEDPDFCPSGVNSVTKWQCDANGVYVNVPSGGSNTATLSNTLVCTNGSNNPVPDCTTSQPPCTSNCGPPPCTSNCGGGPPPCTSNCGPPPCTSNCGPQPVTCTFYVTNPKSSDNTVTIIANITVTSGNPSQFQISDTAGHSSGSQSATFSYTEDSSDHTYTVSGTADGVSCGSSTVFIPAAAPNGGPGGPGTPDALVVNNVYAGLL